MTYSREKICSHSKIPVGAVALWLVCSVTTLMHLDGLTSHPGRSINTLTCFYVTVVQMSTSLMGPLALMQTQPCTQSKSTSAHVCLLSFNPVEFPKVAPAPLFCQAKVTYWYLIPKILLTNKINSKIDLSSVGTFGEHSGS